MRRPRWTKKEDAILRRAWEIVGAKRKECAAFLPGRSVSAVINRIQQLDLEKKDGKYKRAVNHVRCGANHSGWKKVRG
jgi:hypothetical protein